LFRFKYTFLLLIVVGDDGSIAIGYTTDDWSSIEWGGFGVDVVSGVFDLKHQIEV
jgi:hypothetical protein